MASKWDQLFTVRLDNNQSQVVIAVSLDTIAQRRPLSYPKYVQKATIAQLVHQNLFCVHQATSVKVDLDKLSLVPLDFIAWGQVIRIKSVLSEPIVHQHSLSLFGVHQVLMVPVTGITSMLLLVVLNADVVSFQHLMLLDNA